MCPVKKQHYVPQFYLRGFVNKKSQVNVYDKFRQKSFPANIRDVASSNYFYDLSQEFIAEAENKVREIQKTENADDEFVNQVLNIVRDTQMLEKRLSQMESRFARVLQKVIEALNKRRRFKNKYRSELALMASVQFWRTNEQRQSMMELDSKVEQGVMQMVNKMNEVKGTNFSAKDLKIAYDPEETALRHKMSLFDTDLLLNTASIFASHIWTIAVNDTDIPFYTSDHPIALRSHKTDDWLSNTGIESPGIEIMFPLNFKYVLHMFERSFHHNLNTYDGKLIYVKDDHVTYTNSNQVLSSHRQVYSSLGNFNLIETMIEELPHLKKPISRWE